MNFEEWLCKLLNESLILQIVPVFKDSFVSFALTLQINLLHIINELLEFFLRQLFLLDGLPGRICANSPVSLHYLRIQLA